MAVVGQKETHSTLETNPSPLTPQTRTMLITLDDFRGHLGGLAKTCGSNAELGRRLGVTGQFIDYLIAGKRKPGKKLLKAIGARRVLMLEIEVEAQ